MSNTTRIGAIALVLSLVVLRFAHIVPLPVILAGVVVSFAILLVGLLQDRRARQWAQVHPGPNWAEELTAKVRRERAAATAAQDPQLAGDVSGR